MKPKYGEKSHLSKLTQSDIGEIRKINSIEKISQKELAKKFNVNQSAISRILSNKRWCI